MDRTEKIGLGAALGGHALLLALLVFGALRAVQPPLGSDGGGSGDGVAVEIVSESAASEPAAVTEAASVEEVEPVVEETEITPEVAVEPTPVPVPTPKAVPKPAQKTIAKPVAKPTPKPATKAASKPAQKTLQRPATKTGTGRDTGSSDFERNMERTLGGLGSGTGNKPKAGPGEGTGKGASLKTAGQIRNEVNAILGPKILRYIRQCAPSGLDVNKIVTTVTLNLTQSGGIASLSGVSQRGVTENNKPQAAPMERCVTGAIRKAAPFTELNPKDYDGWKTHRMSFQPN
jgi:periplasmic protein TonB